MTLRLAVSACLFDARGRVLLVRRRNAPYAGLWSLPGGRVEDGETPEQAVIRETFEETGVVAGGPAFLRSVEAGGDGRYFVIMVFHGTVDQEALPGSDALDARMVEADALAALAAGDGVTPGLLEIVTMAQQRRRDMAAALASKGP